MTYHVNEVFYSLQGEGHRAGTANVFVRFSGCNLACNYQEDGFDCDTEFTSGTAMTEDDLVAAVLGAVEHLDEGVLPHVGVIFTGGEPLLQLTAPLVDRVRDLGLKACIETNGTKPARGLALDWISCSPKTAEHTLLLEECDELRYVRRVGMAIPRPRLKYHHLFISPACGPDGFDADDIAWCVGLVKDNPLWRLSMQQHRIWRVR